MEQMKRCPRCETEKPATTEFFHRSKQQKDGLKPYCKPCLVAYNKAWRHGDIANAKTVRDAARRWAVNNPEKKKLQQREYVQRYKRQVMAHYGPEGCACCGIKNIAFLAIDHIGGGGNKHRKELKYGSGTAFYLWLIRGEYPSGYRVLCHNCNFTTSAYGECPHEQERREAALAPLV
jgi:hypothetical protein